MNIYNKQFKPTYLYVKTHNKTGLKYFGKTVSTDPHRYKGSGRRWLNHIRKHGYDVTTEVLGYFTNQEECINFALEFSKCHDITNLSSWANIIPENGINGGGDCSQMHTPVVREKATKTSYLKYGVAIPILAAEIRDKAQTTYIKNHGTLGAAFSTDNCITKRNNTNLSRYGSKCAANKDGNPNSRKTQKALLNRPEVLALKLLRSWKYNSLPPRWQYKPTEEILSMIRETIQLPDYERDTSNYTSTQLSRHQSLQRINVRYLKDLSTVYNIQLGINWFQRSDERVNNQIMKIYEENSHTLLQSLYQYLSEFPEP